MGLGRRNARQHETVGFQKNALDSSAFWEYKPQQQVMTVDGVPGVVTAVLDGPYPGTEEYEVTLDNGLGGGSYTASQLQPLAGTTASHDHEATGLHTADQDYPELGNILHERPPIERMTFSAARGDTPFEIRHEETNTGGLKFPKRVDMTAHHPESGEQVGKARYYPPKRKGGPVSIDEVKGDAPGAASALLDEIEIRHPGSRTHFMYEVKRNNNNPDVTGHENEDFGEPSDWDTHYPNVADTIHRGVALKLPSHSARVVNSPGNTKDEHLAEIHSAMPEGPNVGTHWTENEHSAQLFAHNAISDYRTAIPVVLHAQKPALKDIETRQPHLYRGGVLPYGNGYAKENEIPVRRGREVKVTGISWKPDAPHPDADESGWVHHTYDEPMHHTAAMEDVEDESTQEAEPEIPPCAYCGSDQMQIAGDNGRAQQAKCQVCGGMMSAPYGLQFKPELIGDPSNHPKDDPDPASGGVPGAANMRVPVKRMNDSDYTASLHTASDDEQDTSYRMQHEAGERDWCTFRHRARCFYPGPLNAEGIRLGTPQDRGPCAWDYWQQQVCPISEPGPMALMQAKGSKIDELQDPEFRFHFTASWSDVRAKARRIRSEGQVNITVATNEGVGGEVKGDHHVYETVLTYVPGTYKVGAWECGCKWAAYAWGRSPAYKRFEGRMCFLPGTKISMADGTHKPIEQVRPGDRVLTHDGVGTVRNLWNNHYNGEIVGLTRSGSSRQVWATVDHGMFANTSMRDNIGSSSTKSYGDRKAVRNKDAWGRTEAGALQVGDWLMGTYADAVLTAPTVSLGDLHEHLVLRNGRGRLETPTERSGRIYTGASLPEFAFTNEFAVLLGYYLAEGNVEHKNRHGVPRIVQWTFGAREDEYVAEISAALETLGAGTPRVYRSHNRILIKVSNAALALLLARLTGTHATQKSLHPDLMQAPPEFQETLLRTYLNGDGCESMAATASRELARQIVALGCRTGHYVPREHVATNNRGPANREKGQPIYYVETAGRYMQGRERLWENLYGARITGVERRQYHGPVYNLNVDDQHTYAVEDTVVFNCSHALAMQFEAQAKGMFGRAVEPSTERPKWLRHHTPVVTQFERDSGENLTRRAVPPGNMRRTYEGALDVEGIYSDDHGLDLVHPPVYAYVISELQDPVDAMNFMAALGMSHSAARAVMKDVSAERATGELHFEASLQLLAEEGEHGGNEKKRCPDCGSMISVNDEKCPHCHHVFSQHEHHHGAKTPGEGDLMSRGMVIGGEWDKDAVHRVMNGNATAHDLLHHIDKSDVGDFWYPHEPHLSHESNISGAKDFAQTETSDHPSEDLDREHPIGEVGVVLVGHKPHGWDPANNPDDGLMGNSYIPHSADVPLHQIHYHDHNGDWHTADAAGHSVHVTGGGYDEPTSHVTARGLYAAASTTPSGTIRPVSSHSDKPEQPSVAGLALKARDTGRVLMLQRGMHDENDPARGRWEWPGGHLEDGDQTSLHGAIREWEEETGHPFPEGGIVHHTWTSPNGVYQGHLVLVPDESAIQFQHGRQTVNPDNPDGDQHEQAAWWDPDHARKNPALREELKAGTPWKEIKAAGNAKTASVQPEYSVQHDEEGPTFEAHSGGQNVGYLTTHDKGDHVFFDGLYVHPDHRSSGIGRQLMNRALDYHQGRQVALKPEPYAEEGQEHASGPSSNQLQQFYSTFGFKPAGEYMTRTAATADPLYGLEEASPMSPPQHSRSQNPASTGWATAQDPHSWDDADNNATNFGALPADGFLGSLHDEPEAALPSTDGAESELEDERDDASPSQYDENDAELTPNTTLASAGSTSDIVARFQATAAASALGGGKDGGSHHAAQQTNNKEIARAAQEFLTKRALKDFNFAEQQELINEGARDKTMARNSDVLDIEGTHYNALEAALAAEEALEDSAELFV